MLPGDELRIVRVDLLRGEWRDVQSTLSPAELERAVRFRFEADRQQYVRSHVALRRALGDALDSDPRALVFIRGPHEKPELEGMPLRFSLSHAAGLALIAIAHRAVGVDAERVRSGLDRDVATFLSPAERAALAALPHEQQEEAFFRAWVRKEALLKARGTGLMAPLEDFDVTLAPDLAPRLLATRPDPADAARWTLADVPVPAGWLGAVAIAAGDHRLHVVDPGAVPA